MPDKKIFESIVKSGFGAVPIAGQFLNEVFFDYWSRVKQDRYNSFLDEFQKYLEKNNTEIRQDLLNTEDFGDLFEAVIKKVVQTRSKDKLRRFQMILYQFVKNGASNEYTGTYLDIIERINETQIQILVAHLSIKEEVKFLIGQQEYLRNEMLALNDKLENESVLEQQGKHSKYYDYTKAILGIDHKLKSIKDQLAVYATIRSPEYYKIDRGELTFLFQDLYSKGLMSDLSIGKFDSKPFETMAVTEFGKSFLKFLEDPTNNG